MTSKRRARLDHLVYGVPHLAEGIYALEEILGLRATPGGSHPGWGTANALFALSPDTYLEIIGPDPEQREPMAPRPFGLDASGSPGLLGWAVKGVGLRQQARDARVRGYDPGPVQSMGRRRPDGVELAWELALPVDWGETLGGLVPFLIDWGRTVHPAAEAVSGLRLEKLSGRHPTPEKAAERLVALGVFLEVERRDAVGLEAVLESPRGEVLLSSRSRLTSAADS